MIEGQSPAIAHDASEVGLIGLGLIGMSLAKRLLGQGFRVHGYDVAPARCGDLDARGGIAAASARAVGQACRTVLLAVFDTSQVESVLEAEGGLEARPGQLVICTSTCDPYSRAMDTRGTKMVESDFTPHAWLKQSLKDFELMKAAAERVGQQLPLARVYTELIESCIAHGEGELDNSAVIQELRRRRHPVKR